MIQLPILDGEISSWARLRRSGASAAQRSASSAPPNHLLALAHLDGRAGGGVQAGVEQDGLVG